MQCNWLLKLTQEPYAHFINKERQMFGLLYWRAAARHCRDPHSVVVWGLPSYENSARGYWCASLETVGNREKMFMNYLKKVLHNSLRVLGSNKWRFCKSLIDTDIIFKGVVSLVKIKMMQQQVST
jgi:hypothetical protein